MSIKKTIIFSLIPVTVLLIILEITGRIIYPFDPMERAKIMAERDPRVNLSYLSTNVDALTVLTDIHAKGSRYIPFLGWIGIPNADMATIKTNELGFRDSKIQDRKPNDFRILLLGGSTAWGLGASSNKNTAAGKLQSLLNDGTSAVNYRVFNAAYPAWTSRQEMISLTEFYDRFDPDLIIALTGYNDLHVLTHNGDLDLPMRQEGSILAKAVSEQVKPMTTLHALRKVAGSLGIWRIVIYFREQIALAKPIRKKLVEFQELQAEKGIKKVVDRYIIMSQYAARQGAEFLIALQPELYTSKKVLTEEEEQVQQRFVSRYENINENFLRYRSFLTGALQHNDTLTNDIVDLGNAFDGLEKPVFIDDCHFNDTGYAQVASMLKQKLINRLPQR